MPRSNMRSATRPSPARLRALAVVAISTVIALVAAVLAYGVVRPVAAASTHVFLDTLSPSVGSGPSIPSPR